MRYFRKKTNKVYQNALKEHYKSLTKDEKRTVRKEKFWSIFSIITAHVTFFLPMLIGIYLIKLIPTLETIFLKILVITGKILIGIILTIVSGFLTYGVTLPLFKKAHSYNLPAMKKDVFSKACSHLRDYYGLQEPYIITKCFDSSNEAFKNHDICIFVVNNELRITVDLVRGFLYSDKDLGCYAFSGDEITLTKKQNEKQLLVELKVDDGVSNNITFLLGYQAKGFIEKNFLTN